MIVRQLLHGINFLHKERRNLHRDMKPGNVLLSSNGFVKVADFGISRSMENTMVRRPARAGVWLVRGRASASAVCLPCLQLLYSDAAKVALHSPSLDQTAGAGDRVHVHGHGDLHGAGAHGGEGVLVPRRHLGDRSDRVRMRGGAVPVCAARGHEVLRARHGHRQQARAAPGRHRLPGAQRAPPQPALPAARMQRRPSPLPDAAPSPGRRASRQHGATSPDARGGT